GFETINPFETDLAEKVKALTDEAMADIVFEVTGTAFGAETMTSLLKVRGRIVMVAIHAQSKQVDLFRFFWKELQMVGARVYEPEDFEKAISVVAEDRLPLDRIITKILPLEEVQEAFEMIDKNPEGMKYLLKCSD